MNAARRFGMSALLLGIAASAVFAGVVAGADRSAAIASVVERPAAASAHPEATVLLDAVRAGSRLVAVGERGIVLMSDDAGKTWRQATASPTSATLTAVEFASSTHGWATGHAGLILATDDGGDHWHEQLDGTALARAALTQAQAALPDAADKPAATKAVAAAERLVADGADKPFFDLWFADERHGFAVGAYNLFVTTDDGGATWVPAMQRLPNPKGNHLYAIQGAGDLIVIAGEQGLLLRSTDGGRSFKALASPYPGSFFTLALLPGGELLAAGLRGNAFRSTDRGDTWQAIIGLPLSSWLASTVSPDGTAWLGNQAGELFVSHDAGQGWKLVPPPPGAPSAPLTSLLLVAPGSMLTTTVRGIGHVRTGLIAGE